MKDKVTCRAKIETNFDHKKKVISNSFIVIAIVAFINLSACTLNDTLREVPESIGLKLTGTYCGLFIILFLLLRFLDVLNYIASCCSFTLEEGQIIGQKKILFIERSLQIPIDHLDNIVISYGIWDRLFGGKTILIRSCSGRIKFHYVQNAEDFATAVMEKIEESKKKELIEKM
ncbi:MAG: hypothetical protein LUG91_04765 [Ruminococcus sp.]|nr:hypothetical protein [Ruminococcus sp.]